MSFNSYYIPILKNISATRTQIMVGNPQMAAEMII